MLSLTLQLKLLFAHGMILLLLLFFLQYIEERRDAYDENVLW